MRNNTPQPHGRWRLWAERIGLFGPAGLLTLLAFVAAYHFVAPSPPRHIVMATGAPDGVYHYYGRLYRDLLAKEGIEVRLVETPGAVANIELLSRGAADVGFVQGGTRDDGGETPLRSLASLYFEPVWVFARRELGAARLADLQGRRVAIGLEGSGTRAIARQLLADIGLDETGVAMSPLGGSEAIAALRDGKLDAAFLIAPANAPALRALLADAALMLLPIDRAAAYRLQHRFLSLLTLPEGALDLKADLPGADTLVIAPAANLVVRDEFHPALAELLLIEARKIHGYAGVFEEAGEFPSRQHLEYPIADAAQRFFDNGPSFLQRYLPFWAANLIDRLKIMLLPLVALAYPLFKVIVPAYDWRMRSRINRWYKTLQALEHHLEAGATPEELRGHLAALETLEHQVRRQIVPVAYGNDLYSLRGHILMLREELRRLLDRSG